MQKNYLKFNTPISWLVIAGIAGCGVYGSLSWCGPVPSTIFFIVWLLATTRLAHNTIQKIFTTSEWLSSVLGCFIAIFSYGFVANIFTSWFILTNETIAIALLLISAMWFGWQKYLKSLDNTPVVVVDKPLFAFRSWWFVVGGLLSIISVVILFFSRTGVYITTPWQVIPFSYICIIFVLTVLVYFLAFSSRRTSLILAGIIIFSFLLHSYLLVYQDGFGGDRWRHIGSEIRIMRGIEYQPTLITNTLWYTSVAGIQVPRALIDSAKISYGFEWSLAVTVAKITGGNLIVLDKYIGIILLSLFLPLVLYVVALQLWPHKQFAYMAALVPTLFHVIQYYSSQTLPAGLSFIFFIFVVGLLVTAIERKDKKIYTFCFFAIALMYFGYSLGFFLGLVAGLVAMIFISRRWFSYIAAIVAILIPFVMERLSYGTRFLINFSPRQLYQVIFQQTNILFYETGRFLPHDTLLAHRAIQIIGLIVVCGAAYSACALCVSRRAARQYWVAITGIVILNFLAAHMLLDGLFIVSRRLDIFIAILAVPIISWGIIYCVKNKTTAIIVIIFLSCATVLTYGSGPVLNAMVTHNESEAMNYIWQQVESSSHDYCVLANTWPLLALEAYSGKEIVAGNFPSDYNHQQPERVRLFDAVKKNPTQDIFDEARRVTGARQCYLAVSSDDEGVAGIIALLGKPVSFGDVLVWRFK